MSEPGGGYGQPPQFSVPRNLPGLDYASSMVDAWSRAILDHFGTVNDSWSRVRAGQYDLTDLMQSIAGIWASYASMATELVRAPLQTEQPAWAYLNYQGSNVLQYQVRLPKRAPGSAHLQTTFLRPFGAGESLPADIIRCAWADEQRRDAINIWCDDNNKLEAAELGDYIGFIYDSTAGSGPPLVILMLRVLNKNAALRSGTASQPTAKGKTGR